MKNSFFDIRTGLFNLFKDSGQLTKNNVNQCPWLPSYNTVQRNGFNLNELNHEFYYKIPQRCKECETIIPYEKRNTNVFCSSSCSAKHNNVKRTMNKFKYCPLLLQYCNCKK